MSNVTGVASERRKTTSRYRRYTSDVHHFFSQSQPQDLIAYTAGRDVPSIRNFQHSNDLSYNGAERMKARIISLNNEIDTEIELSSAPW